MNSVLLVCLHKRRSTHEYSVSTYNIRQLRREVNHRYLDVSWEKTAGGRQETRDVALSKKPVAVTDFSFVEHQLSACDKLFIKVSQTMTLVDYSSPVFIFLSAGVFIFVLVLPIE